MWDQSGDTVTNININTAAQVQGLCVLHRQIHIITAAFRHYRTAVFTCRPSLVAQCDGSDNSLLRMMCLCSLQPSLWSFVCYADLTATLCFLRGPAKFKQASSEQDEGGERHTTVKKSRLKALWRVRSSPFKLTRQKTRVACKYKGVRAHCIIQKHMILLTLSDWGAKSNAQ